MAEERRMTAADVAALAGRLLEFPQQLFLMLCQTHGSFERDVAKQVAGIG